ncbi:MAG: VanZ family protein [Candidatus Omnitrophica bacterium]|nr:VanZ family protein [Candidatus Omnitrophota bacterium]
MIFGVSAVPGKQVPHSLSVFDKFIHMSIYTGLAVLFARAVAANSIRFWPSLIWAISLAFVAFYGITDEFHQSFVDGRSSDLQDWIADLIGGSAGAAIYLLWLQIKRAKQIKSL